MRRRPPLPPSPRRNPIYALEVYCVTRHSPARQQKGLLSSSREEGVENRKQPVSGPILKGGCDPSQAGVSWSETSLSLSTTRYGWTGHNFKNFLMLQHVCYECIHLCKCRSFGPFLLSISSFRGWTVPLFSVSLTHFDLSRPRPLQPPPRD